MMAMKGIHPKVAPQHAKPSPHVPHPNDVVIVGGHPQRPPMPKNYFTMSLLVTIFCCFPFGLFGLCKSLNAEEQYKRRDYEGAVASSKWALRFSQLGLVCGIITYVASISFLVVYHVLLSHTVAKNWYS